jgi:hypothetical protein
MLNQLRFQFWKSSYFWLLVVAIFAIPLLADFNLRLSYSRQLAAEEAQLRQQISLEQNRQIDLKEMRQYVQSDAYVEHWARRMRLAKSGETPVIPAPMDLSRAPRSVVSVVKVANDPASEWWVLFFDRVPNP